MDLKIINNGLLKDFLEAIPRELEKTFEALHDAEISTDTFLVLHIGISYCII